MGLTRWLFPALLLAGCEPRAGDVRYVPHCLGWITWREQTQYLEPAGPPIPGLKHTICGRTKYEEIHTWWM